MFLEKLSNSNSRIFLAVWAGFIVGVALASVLDWARKDWLMLLGVLFFLVLSLGIKMSKKWQVIILLVIFLFLGGLRFVLSEPTNALKNLRFYSGRFAILSGVAVSDGSISGNYQRVYFHAQGIKFFTTDNYQKIKGKTIIYLDKYPTYNYGAKLEVRCSLVNPKDLEQEGQFSYADYLHKEGVWVACFNAQVLNQVTSSYFDFYKVFLNLKNYFNQKINYLLPEPHSSFLRGLLYGDRATMPDDLKNSFSRTGVTHIIAISGYNITIIVASLLVVFKFLRLSRWRAFWFTLGVILFFVLLSGASASVVRAAVMGVLVLWGKRSGRKAMVGRILILSAAVMLLINPRLLFFDVGFQLSFLSTIGLIYFTPILEKIFLAWSNKFGLKEIILTTLSAIIFTTPLVIYTFGKFSVIAPLANLLILPVVPLAMLLGFVSLFAAIVYLPLGQFLAYGTWVVLSYIIKVAEFLASWKLAAINLIMPGWLMILLYGCLIYFVYADYKKEKI
ncbi:MAG: ComEC/Rec2 family competence protein [Candidatus Magasanikbacteria bacterium]|nr:ComEC/Rec2 family competence protein [Candidatus Magasanikbacteria bacterium]